MKTGFLEYLKKNYILALLAFLFSCACFFVMLTHNMVLIDEEVHLTETVADPVYFLFGSRYTDYLLGKLFWNGRIIPFFSDFFALLIWNVSAFIFGSVFFREEHKSAARFISLAYFS